MPSPAKRIIKGKKEIKKKSQLGEFTNFSKINHGSARAKYDENIEKVQRSVTTALCKLNDCRMEYPISVSGREGTYKGEVGFEVGIAEGTYFNYLDNKMLLKLNKSISQGNLLPLLDFLIIVTYSYDRNNKNIHLNFDHYQLRLIFHDKDLEMHLFHSKGIRRMLLDEFIDKIFKDINKEMKLQSLKPLSVEEIKVL